MSELDTLLDAIADRVAARIAARLPTPTVAAPPNNDAWLTPREAAELLKCSWQRLETLRREGGGPPFVREGRRVRYARKDLEDYQNSRPKRRNTSGGAA